MVGSTEVRHEILTITPTHFAKMRTPDQKAKEAARMRLYRKRPEIQERNREYMRHRRAQGLDRAAIARYRKGTGETTIYFVQQSSAGPIKIGFTTKKVAVRLSELQVGNPETLTLLKAVVTTREVEKVIHNHFQHLRLRGEWFKPSKALREFIKSL